MDKVSMEEIQKKLAEDLEKGQALLDADRELIIKRREKLGLSLFCTYEEFYSTPME
jgi:hypothetical protein